VLACGLSALTASPRFPFWSPAQNRYKSARVISHPPPPLGFLPQPPPHIFLADPRNRRFRGPLLIERTSVKLVSPPSPSPQLSIPPRLSCGYPLLCLDLSTMARKSKSVLSQSESHCRPHRASPTIESVPHTGPAADDLYPSSTVTLTPPSSPFLRLFNPTILSSDHRNSKLSPSPTTTALSTVSSRTYISSRRQHVLPSLNQHHIRPNSVVNQRNGLQTSDKSSQSSTTLKGSPTTSSHPVFHNVNDLAAHHGIPTFLPPTPRTVTRRTPSSMDEMTPTSDNDAFSSLCSEYLTMLDTTSPEISLDAASLPLSSSDEQAAQAILSILHPGESGHVPLLTHQESLTDCGCSPGDSSAKPSEFLTSPMESPFDDFLSTPGLRNDDFSPDFTSPLIADGDDFGAQFHNTPLFDDAGLFEPPSSDKRVMASLFPSVNLDSMYTISPATPALDASPLFAPPPSRLSSSLPNGTRKNLTPDALIPLDAPVQLRNYLTPSATSRKEPPRKRSRTEALDDDDEATEDMSGLDPIAAKRLQNTLAARRSRKRKLEHLLEIEANLDHEKQQKEQWRSRAMTLEALLLSHGIPVPPAINY